MSQPLEHPVARSNALLLKAIEVIVEIWPFNEQTRTCGSPTPSSLEQLPWDNTIQFLTLILALRETTS